MADLKKLEVQLLAAVKKSNIAQLQELLNPSTINSLCVDARCVDYNLLIKALYKSQTDIAKLFIERGFRVYKRLKFENTVLHYAVKLDNLDLIEALMAKGAALDILTLNEENKTPFHLSIDKNQLTCIKLFLSYCDSASLDKKHLLHYAIHQDKTEIVSALIEKNCSLTIKNEEKLTPFCIAMERKNFKILDRLMSRWYINNVRLDKFNDVAAAYIASLCGNLNLVKRYIGCGLPVSVPLKLNSDTWSCFDNYAGYTLLHFAVERSNFNVVEFLLSQGADILVQNENGLSPLHIAFENKERGIWETWQKFEDNNSIIDLILKANMKFKFNPMNKNGLTHFHIACSRDDSAIVEHFLNLNAFVNQTVGSKSRVYKGFTPLHFAAKFRCKKTAEFLLKNGADVQQRDFNEMTALHIAVKETCLDTAGLLLQYGADITSVDSFGNTPLHWAFEKKNYRMIDLLLTVPNLAKSNPTNRKGISHFHIACTRNNVHVVRSFIDYGVCLGTCVPVQSNENNSGFADLSGYSPLHFAVSYNSAKVVQLLLHTGANPEIQENNGYTSLHLACQYKYEMFGEFIEYNLQNLSKYKSIRKIDWSSNKKNHLKIIDLLLNYGSEVNIIDSNGNTPVFYACSAVYEIKNQFVKDKLNCSEVLWYQIIENLFEELCGRRKWILNNLLKLDVNLDKCYKNGSILHYICSRDDKDSNALLELFLKKGANIEAKDEKMLTPLHYATIEGRTEIVSTLLDYGANVDCIDPTDNTTPLLIVSKKSSLYNSDILDLLLVEGANVNAKHLDGKTALHNLAKYTIVGIEKTFLILDKLQTLGVDVNSQDSDGFTALHIAGSMENIWLVHNLLYIGADINIEDNQKRNIFCLLLDRVLNRNTSPAILIVMVDLLRRHIIKMDVAGLPVNKEVKLSLSKFDTFEYFSEFSSDEMQEHIELMEECQAEVKLLRDTKIHDHCTLYDVLFKNENAMAQLVNNPTFQAIVNFRSFEKKFDNYEHFIHCQYLAGEDRGKLLPKAKYLINCLTGMHIPDTCSENICKYFANAELRESIEILRNLLDLKIDNSDSSMQLRIRRNNKRQKVN